MRSNTPHEDLHQNRNSGQTGLFGGPRVAKDDPRIEAYGTVNKLNAALGAARAETLPLEIETCLQRVQNELFSIGSELATPRPAEKGIILLNDGHVAYLDGDRQPQSAICRR